MPSTHSINFPKSGSSRRVTLSLRFLSLLRMTDRCTGFRTMHAFARSPDPHFEATRILQIEDWPLTSVTKQTYR